MTPDERFMLLVWDLTFFSRYSSDVTPRQYDDLVDLFVSVWGLSVYEFPSTVAHGA